MSIEYLCDYGYSLWVREELGCIVNTMVNSSLIRSKEIKEKIKYYEGEVYTEQVTAAPAHHKQVPEGKELSNIADDE